MENTALHAVGAACVIALLLAAVAGARLIEADRRACGRRGGIPVHADGEVRCLAPAALR